MEHKNLVSVLKPLAEVSAVLRQVFQTWLYKNGEKKKARPDTVSVLLPSQTDASCKSEKLICFCFARLFSCNTLPSSLLPFHFVCMHIASPATILLFQVTTASANFPLKFACMACLCFQSICQMHFFPLCQA